MCNVYEPVKVFWHIKPQIIDCQVRAYSFQRDPISYMKSYLTDRQQKVI